MNIAIAHQKGGVGKSTICWHLAHTMDVDLVLDLDSQQTLHSLNSIRVAQGHTPLRLESPTSKQQLLNVLQANEENLTLTDLGGFDSDLNRIAIAAANVVIAPVSDSPVEILGLQKFRNTLNEISQSLGEEINAYVLLNRVHHSRTRFHEFEETVRELGFKMFNTRIIEHKAGMGESVCSGLSVKEYMPDPHSRIVQSFLELESEILEQLIETSDLETA